MTNDPSTKVTMWSIKYLATMGIEEVSGWEADGYLSTMPGRWTNRFERIDRECFRTRDEAVKAGEVKRARLVASATKSIDKLKKMVIA